MDSNSTDECSKWVKNLREHVLKISCRYFTSGKLRAQ